MDFELSEAQRDLVERISDRAGQIARCGRRDISRTDWNDAGAAALTGLFAPAACGGSDVTGAASQALAMQALARNGVAPNLLLALHCHLAGAVAALSQPGMDGQQSGMLPRLVSGEWYGARTVAGAVTATPAGDGFTLSGSASVASAGLQPDLVIVFADTGAGDAASRLAFALPLAGTTGAAWTPMAGGALGGMDCLQLEGALATEQMEVRGGGGIEEQLALRGMLVLQAAKLGLLQRLRERALDAARVHIRRSRLKGMPAQQFQMLGHKLADFSVRFDACELMLQRAAWQIDRNGRDDTWTALAGLAIKQSLLPCALELAGLQCDYGFDADQSWTALLADAVEYGHGLAGTEGMQHAVAATFRS